MTKEATKKSASEDTSKPASSSTEKKKSFKKPYNNHKNSPKKQNQHKKFNQDGNKKEGTKRKFSEANNNKPDSKKPKKKRRQFKHETEFKKQQQEAAKSAATNDATSSADKNAAMTDEATSTSTTPSAAQASKRVKKQFAKEKSYRSMLTKVRKQREEKRTLSSKQNKEEDNGEKKENVNEEVAEAEAATGAEAPAAEEAAAVEAGEEPRKRKRSGKKPKREIKDHKKGDKIKDLSTEHIYICDASVVVAYKKDKVKGWKEFVESAQKNLDSQITFCTPKNWKLIEFTEKETEQMEHWKEMFPIAKAKQGRSDEEIESIAQLVIIEGMGKPVADEFNLRLLTCYLEALDAVEQAAAGKSVENLELPSAQDGDTSNIVYVTHRNASNFRKIFGNEEKKKKIEEVVQKHGFKKLLTVRILRDNETYIDL